MAKQYWLFKAEPEDYSIELFRKDKKTYWDGVRNYQARNFLRDSVKKGDEVFIYQSNTDPLAVVALAEVVKEGYPDFTAMDPDNSHFDPKSTPENPIWFMVDIKLTKVLKTPVLLSELKKNPKLKEFKLIQRGNRLSVMPVTATEWNEILAMSEK
ncbi:MAG: EVE domain-containing protein [Ignavibacteriaceae bacterium]|nr:EVE domain-containing protein [Ignavibacteriaceae bacterium]